MIKNMQLEEKLRAACQREDLDILFREDYGIAEALRDLKEVGDWQAWNAEGFNRIAFHATANYVRIKIATRQHATLDCKIVMRIE